MLNLKEPYLLKVKKKPLKNFVDVLILSLESGQLP